MELEVQKGRTVGLVGESGSGKTTLGKTVLRLLAPTAGKIFFEGEDITELDSARVRPLRREMQMIFQNPYGSLNPRMNVGSLVSEGISIHNTVKKEERNEFVVRLLGEVGLGADVMKPLSSRVQRGAAPENSHSARDCSSPEVRRLRRACLSA